MLCALLMLCPPPPRLPWGVPCNVVRVRETCEQCHCQYEGFIKGPPPWPTRRRQMKGEGDARGVGKLFTPFYCVLGITRSCLGRSRQFWKSCVAHGATSCLAISAGERLRSTNQRSFLTPRTLTTTGSSTKRGKWSNSQSLPSRGIAFSSFVPVSASLPRNRKPGRSTYMEIS